MGFLSWRDLRSEVREIEKRLDAIESQHSTQDNAVRELVEILKQRP